MIIGRISGWFLVVLAIVMASAEAVMALGTGSHSGLATADIWTLLVGRAPADFGTGSWLGTAGFIVMAMPAWLVFGLSGILLLHLCRYRRPRRRRFKTIN